jgi:hypothetical protein
MGGNAIKSAQRINKATFDQYWIELCEIFPELRMERTLSYRQKEDFGDIDIVVQASLEEYAGIRGMVRDRIGAFGKLEEYDNGPFYSFLYKTAQVDFIFHRVQDFEIALHYYSWNDVCNFIGRVSRSLDFKFGHDGLWYDQHLDDHYKISVFVSNDIEKILTFLGYDYERWLKGFDTIEDILAYGASSTYFNALYFSLEEQNNVDRVRNKKRKMYQNMLKYIEAHALQPKPKLTADEREAQARRAAIHFQSNFLDEVAQRRADYCKHLQYKSLFNGDIVKQLTGLEGKELGKFIQELKTEENAINSFEAKVLQFGAEYVNEVVLRKLKKEQPQEELMGSINKIQTP